MAHSVFVAKTVEISAGKGKLVNLDGKPVVVFNTGTSFCAIDELCTHRAGPLSEGKLDGHTVSCPWHGAKFDVVTGKVISGPAVRNLRHYDVVVENGEIWVVVG